MNRYLRIFFVLLCLMTVQSALAQGSNYLKREVSHKTVREGAAGERLHDAFHIGDQSGVDARIILERF